MFRKSLLCCAMLAALFAVASPVFAEDVALTIPTLGIDWAATVTSLITLVGGVLVGALGLWAGIRVVYMAKRFIGGAVMGR